MAYPQTPEHRPLPVDFASQQHEPWRKTPRSHAVCPFYLFFTSFYLILLQQPTIKRGQGADYFDFTTASGASGPQVPFPAVVNLLY